MGTRDDGWEAAYEGQGPTAFGSEAGSDVAGEGGRTTARPVLNFQHAAAVLGPEEDPTATPEWRRRLVANSLAASTASSVRLGSRATTASSITVRSARVQGEKAQRDELEPTIGSDRLRRGGSLGSGQLRDHPP
ncbi:MAG: hypothetical protein M3P85_08710 [Actinomycetota bacterium]|nr:hypothetical protein [Actinomycetota bacterium]